MTGEVGVLLNKDGDVHLLNGDGKTVCRRTVPPQHKPVTSKQMLVYKIHWCDACYTTRQGRRR